jgi:hypothetical protein
MLAVAAGSGVLAWGIDAAGSGHLLEWLADGLIAAAVVALLHVMGVIRPDRDQ